MLYIARSLVGRHKHFRIIALQSMIHEVTGFLIPFAEMWSRLSGMYDLSEMDELVSLSLGRA